MDMAGRPSKYDDINHPKIVKYMARCGMIDKEIAKELGITVATLNGWKNKHPEFLESLKQNKYFVDHLVEESLLKKALGFTYLEREETKNGKGELSKVKTTEKTVLPDTTACIFWLKNRQPKWWRDTHHIVDDTDHTEHLDKLKELADGFRKSLNEKK